jgi:hypothetical protein
MISTILFIILASPLVARVNAADPTWKVTFYAKFGGYTSFHAILGVADDAISGWDPAYDEVAPPAPIGTGVECYFYNATNTPPPPIDYRKLATSIERPSGNMNWTLKVHTIGFAGPDTMTLNWTTIPAPYSGRIIRASDQAILVPDMSVVSEYSYTQDTDVTVTFTVNFVIPELPLGPLLVVAVCFASYGLFKASKRF